MLAFEIRINNAAPMIVAADNHVIADFTYGVLAINPNSVVIAGFDDFYRYVWLDGEIHHNDEVHIRVVDVDKEKVSVPLKTTKESLESLKEKYDKLQQELKHKGICNLLCTNLFRLKRQKSDCLDLMENEKDEDLTYLTIANHKKHKNVKFF